MTDVKVPENLYFSKTHEWVKIEKSEAKIGITDSAQDQLGDVVFVELPEIGKKVEQSLDEKSKGGEIGSVESTKSVSEIYAPISGKIKEVNEKLNESPELINEEPYEGGWICVIEPKNAEEELENLMGAGEYKNFLDSEE